MTADDQAASTNATDNENGSGNVQLEWMSLVSHDDDEDEPRIEFRRQFSLSFEERLQTLRALRSTGARDWKAQAQLLWMWLCARTDHLFHVWIICFLFYYADLALDIIMMRNFYRDGEYEFIFATLAGIFLGIVFTFGEMFFSTNPQKFDLADFNPRVMLLVGFLLPVQLHVAYLCVFSTRNWRMHPLTVSSKFAEATIEGTVGAIVQTYYLIFQDFDKHPNELKTNYLSVLTSFLSLGWAFSAFDRRRHGLRGLAGVTEGFHLKGLLVFVFRFCEVVSRVASLGLFQLAVRNESFSDFSFGTRGMLSVIVADGVIMFLLTTVFQGANGTWENIQFFIPSMFVFMNPMLLSENAFTMPANVYFLVRFVELSGMMLAAWKLEVFHGGHGNFDHFDGNPRNNLVSLAAFKAEFHNDNVIITACAVCTVLMFVLAFIIRVFLTEHVMLVDSDMFTSHMFTNTEEQLCDSLLHVRNLKNSTSAKNCLDLHVKCSMLSQQAVDRLHRALQKGKHSEDSKLEHGQAHRLEKQSSVVIMVGQTVDLEPMRWGVDLDAWLEEEYKDALVKYQDHASTAVRFVELLNLSYNLNRWLKAEDGFMLAEADSLKHLQRHREVLALLNHVLRDDFATQAVLQDDSIMAMVLHLLPQWRRWNFEDGNEIEQNILLFQEKCSLYARVMQLGWRRHMAFARMAHKFRDAFAARSVSELTSDTFPMKDVQDWLVRYQLHALVEAFRALPDDLKRVGIDEVGMFREEHEVRRVIESLDVVMKARLKTVVGTISRTSDMTEDESLRFAIRAFKNPLLIATVPWDKQVQLNQSLSVLLPRLEPYKLVCVVLRTSTGENNVERYPVTRWQDVDAIFPRRDGVVDWETTTVEFEMVRAREIEDQPLEMLRSTKGWEICETLLLKIFSSITLQDLERVCGEHHPSVKSFGAHQATVEEDVKSALNRKYQLLEGHATRAVDPNTCVALKMFGEGGHEFNSKNIKNTKLKNQTELVHFEEYHEKVLSYFRVVDSRFVWSAAVRQHVKKLQANAKTLIVELRRTKDAFWLRTEAEYTSQARAKETVALKTTVAVEDKLKLAYDELDKARDEREWALKMLEEAEQERAAALLEKDRAEQLRSEAVQAEEEARNDQESKIPTNVLNAFTDAKNAGIDVSWLQKVIRRSSTVSSRRLPERSDVLASDTSR